MKKIMLLVLISIFIVPTVSLAFTSQEKEYINKIKELSSPDQKLPQPPAGYGIIRNNQTGDIVILLKGQNQGKIIGKTTYGGKIIAIYEKWVRKKVSRFLYILKYPAFISISKSFVQKARIVPTKFFMSQPCIKLGILNISLLYNL